MSKHLKNLPGASVGWLFSPSLSDFHCVVVSRPLQSVRRPRFVICFLKAMTNSFHTSIAICTFTKCIFPTLFFQSVFHDDKMMWKAVSKPKIPARGKKNQFMLLYFASPKLCKFVYKLSWTSKFWVVLIPWQNPLGRLNSRCVMLQCAGWLCVPGLQICCSLNMG